MEELQSLVNDNWILYRVKLKQCETRDISGSEQVGVCHWASEMYRARLASWTHDREVVRAAWATRSWFLPSTRPAGAGEYQWGTIRWTLVYHLPVFCWENHDWTFLRYIFIFLRNLNWRIPTGRLYNQVLTRGRCPEGADLTRNNLAYSCLRVLHSTLVAVENRSRNKKWTLPPCPQFNRKSEHFM